MERLIFHVDVNSAFLSWEAASRVKAGEPDLREIPSAVGGDPRTRTGIIVAKSIPAKKYGVQTGEPVAMALRKCPNLVVVPSDFRLYTKNSQAFKAICKSYAPAMESFSIDEVFLDMTGTSLIYPDPIATACEIKDKIYQELGFTVNVGISAISCWRKWPRTSRSQIKCTPFSRKKFRQKCGLFPSEICYFWEKLRKRSWLISVSAP